MAVNCQDCDYGGPGGGFQLGGVGTAYCAGSGGNMHIGNSYTAPDCSYCTMIMQGWCNSYEIGPSGGGTGGGTTPVRPKPTLTGEPVKWRRASGFKRARRGGTGQAVTWRKQSGASEGGLFGLSTTQLLIAGAVGVGAYLILKKRKK